MLPSKNRLKKKEDFEAVYRLGRSISASNVAIRFKKNNIPESRMGVVAGINFSKKAVDRNRIKRQIRAVMGGFLGKIRPGWDVVIVARKEKGKAAASIESRELKKMIGSALEKAKIIS